MSAFTKNILTNNYHLGKAILALVKYREEIKNLDKSKTLRNYQIKKVYKSVYKGKIREGRFAYLRTFVQQNKEFLEQFFLMWGETETGTGFQYDNEMRLGQAAAAARAELMVERAEETMRVLLPAEEVGEVADEGKHTEAQGEDLIDQEQLDEPLSGKQPQPVPKKRQRKTELQRLKDSEEFKYLSTRTRVEPYCDY